MPDEAQQESQRRFTALPKPIKVYSTKINPEQKPDLDKVNSTVLSSGPKSKKEVSYILVRDRHTGEPHHDAITIKTYRLKKGQWHKDREHSLSLDSKSQDDDQLQKLVDFIQAARGGVVPDKSGMYMVVGTAGDERTVAKLQQAIAQVSAAGKVTVLADILGGAAEKPELIRALLDRAQTDPLLFVEAAAALNLATYRHAVDELNNLVETSNLEQDFQKLLADHPWMFGSEYSQLLPRRHWTRGEKQDFVVRRTADGYVELIEIKTPLEGKPLFNYDGSHDNFYASAELSKVIGQVEKYIEELDRERAGIFFKDGVDMNKVRAKIVIGRDGDDKQQAALRRLNGHLHRVEVLTFDQLGRIAARVLSYIGEALRPAAAAKTS